MAGLGTEECRCLLLFDAAKNDPDTLVEIEDEEPDTVPISVWFQFFELEAVPTLGGA
jgi:hypothetical protein